MKRHNMKKLVLAVAFTLALTFGMGIVADQAGFPLTQSAYACGMANGGGC